MADRPAIKPVATSGSYLDLGYRPAVYHGCVELVVTAEQAEASSSIVFPRMRAPFSLYVYAVGSSLHPLLNVYVTSEQESGATLAVKPASGSFVAPDRIAVKWCVRA